MNIETKNFTDGFLLINKPQGPTSFNIVAKIRKKFMIKKVGHCGTLDPLAEGLLVVAIGRSATRLIQYLKDDKTYEFGINFGKQTATGDREGETVKECDNIPTEEQLLEAIPKFIGEISQIPPAFSAIKIDGKRAYQLAREGKEVEMKPRKITIASLTMQTFNAAQKTASFTVDCSSGTYVRTLAEDIAKQCGSLGHCSFIKRTRVGDFLLENAVETEAATVGNVLSTEEVERVCKKV